MRNWREALNDYISKQFSEMVEQPKRQVVTESAKPNKKKVVVLGAGLSGLSCAYKLLQSGVDVTILEKEKEIGGLARTIKYKDFLFDFSAHRFLGKDKELIAEMTTLMEGNLKRFAPELI